MLVFPIVKIIQSEKLKRLMKGVKIFTLQKLNQRCTLDGNIIATRKALSLELGHNTIVVTVKHLLHHILGSMKKVRIPINCVKFYQGFFVELYHISGSNP